MITGDATSTRQTAGAAASPELVHAAEQSVPVKAAAPRRSWGTPWSRSLRVVRIQSGRVVHALSMLLRRRLPLQAVIGQNRFAGVKRVVGVALRYADGRRKRVAICGCLVLAMLLFVLNVRPEPPVKPVAQSPAVVLDEVKIFPPPDSRDLPKSDASRGPEPGRFPPGDATLASGPQFPTAADAAGGGVSRPMPPASRAVWLVGTIEEVERSETPVRSVGHVELPFTSRQSGAPDVPRALHRRQ